MATEVKHGALAHWERPIVRASEFRVVVHGYYTENPDVGAGGVLAYAFNSQRPEKQVNELLVLRSAFRHWYEHEMRVRGVEPTEGYAL